VSTVAIDEELENCPHVWLDEDEDDDVDEEGSDEEDDDGGAAWAAPMRQVISPPQVGRNSACPCGSGVMYKRCCGKADRPARQSVRR
jgi:uncharacterized protein YecA (UPF0149 family)